MKVSNDVLNVLSRAETKGNNFVISERLDRTMYMQVNKVLEAAGGKWNTKAKAHVFGIDASERVEQIIMTGEVDVPKDEFNYFPTPKIIVDSLLEIAELKRGMRVLEPSAGQGAISIPCLKMGAKVDCIELMEENFKVLATDSRYGSLTQADFLKVVPDPVYDRVIMNPPFMNQADIKHVSHALDFLKEGGILVSVMASSVTFRDNNLTKNFRLLVEASGGEVFELPEGSFKESGTMVNTVIVKIPKL